MSSERWRGLMLAVCPLGRARCGEGIVAAERQGPEVPSSTVAPAPASQSICQLGNTSARPVANNCPMGIQAAISPVTKPRSRRVALRLAERRAGDGADGEGDALQPARQQHHQPRRGKGQREEIAEDEKTEGDEEQRQYAAVLHRAADGDGEGEAGQGIDRHEAARQRAVPAIGGDHAGQHRRQLELLEGDEAGEGYAEGDAGPVGSITLHAASPKAAKADGFAQPMQWLRRFAGLRACPARGFLYCSSDVG